MTIPDAAVALVYVKDFSEELQTTFFIGSREAVESIGVHELSKLEQPVVTHDFWLIRDELFRRAGVPNFVIDVGEMQAVVAQKRDLRSQRDARSISVEAPSDLWQAEDKQRYIDAFYRRAPMEADVMKAACGAILDYYHSLQEVAERNGELERYGDIELPVANILYRHIAHGVSIDPDQVRKFREDAEFDFYQQLKSFASDFNVQPEVMNDRSLRDYIEGQGYTLDDVSLEYVLEYLPLPNEFGPRVQSLRKLRDTLNILNELTLSKKSAYPIVDVFGTRTSRILVRSPSLQNVSKRYRSMIRPSDGKNLGYVDYDQFEVGIMAALSGDEQMLRLYGSGDMYELFSTEFLMMNDFRGSAKRLFLSYAYGMSRKAVVDGAVELGVPQRFCEGSIFHVLRVRGLEEAEGRGIRAGGKGGYSSRELHRWERSEPLFTEGEKIYDFPMHPRCGLVDLQESDPICGRASRCQDRAPDA